MHRPTGRVIILAVLLALIAGAAWAAPETIKTLEIGAQAPNFTLLGTDGKYHGLSHYAGAKVLVIVFTCNHCPTAQAYEERIKKLAADYKDKGVALVAISPNDPRAVRLDELGYTDVSDSLRDMRIRAQDKAFNFPYLYDGEKQEVSKAYGPVTTPHVFIFDEQRKLRYVGRVDNSEKGDNITSRDARNAIDALLAGKRVPVEKTKTMGCSIKWASKRDSVKQAFETWAKEPVQMQMIDLEGVKKLMKNNTDKLRLVNIWSTRCGPCVIEFPEFVEINRMYRRRDFEMVSVSVDGSSQKDRVHSFLVAKEASFTNYLYTGADIYAFIEAVDPEWPGPIPYTLLIEPGGKVLYRHLGAINPLEVKKTIVEYLGRTYN